MLFSATSIENSHETKIFKLMTVLDGARAVVRKTTTSINSITTCYYNINYFKKEKYSAKQKEVKMDENWEMRFNGILVEPQVGEIKEIWKNVTVEVLEKPNGEVSIGLYRQDDTERIL